MQNKQILNKENPLTKYKEYSEKTWKEIEDDTGISLFSLIRIAVKDKIQIRKTTLDTVEAIKEGIDVDIINDWE